jgi:hypothetical protein
LFLQEKIKDIIIITNVWEIPGVRLLFDIIDTVTRQKLTATTNAAGLFDAPDPWSSLSDHCTKIPPALRGLGDAKLLTVTELIAHLTYDGNPLGWLEHGRIAGGRGLLGQATHMF